MMKTRMYNIEQVVAVNGYVLAIADRILYIKGYGDQWRPVPLPFDEGDEVKSISSDKDRLYLLTQCNCIYSVYSMYLREAGFKLLNNKDWVRHWRRIPTGIRQQED